MNGRRFLFERLAGEKTEAFDVRAAVGDQIRRLVNTLPPTLGLEGTTAGPNREADIRNFGMAPLVDLSFETPAQRERHIDHLLALLKAFEPRLTDPHVRLTGGLSGADPLGIDIQGRIDADGEEEVIRFRIDRRGLHPDVEPTSQKE